jgi:3-hydroxybutyrate dehydrogenase
LPRPTPTLALNVVIADLKLADAQATADAIAQKGVKTLAVAMDVTDEAAVDAGRRR